MTDQDLYELLDRTAESVPINPPPTALLVRDAKRHRRLRTWGVVLASATTAAAVVIAVALLTPTPTTETDAPQPAASPSPSDSSPLPPPGTRLVGIGQVAVAVPSHWGTNRTRCGTPQRDTVVIDQPVVELCLAPYPPGVDSVAITTGRPPGPDGVPVQVSGVAAEQRRDCDPTYLGPSPSCSAWVYLPSANVTIAVSSDREAIVDRLLEHVYVLPDRVAVPGFMTVNTKAQQRAGLRYVEVLERAGLVADVREVRSRAWPTGFVVSVSPAVGTILSPGDHVSVEVAR